MKNGTDVYNPNECTSYFCIQMSHSSKQGRIWRVSPASKNLLIELNNVPIILARIDTFKPKKKQTWDVHRFGDFTNPLASYKLDELDKFAKDLYAGKFDPESVSA